MRMKALHVGKEGKEGRRGDRQARRWVGGGLYLCGVEKGIR
jgi:hypothetical protein